MSTCPAFRHRIRALPSGWWFLRATKRMASFTCPAVRAGIPSRPTTSRGTARGHTANRRPSFQSRLRIASHLTPACRIKAIRTKRSRRLGAATISGGSGQWFWRRCSLRARRLVHPQSRRRFSVWDGNPLLDRRRCRAAARTLVGSGLKPGVCMRVLDGEQVLTRIFVGESDKWHHQPLSVALLERLRKEGFAGATVLHGVAGFGAHSVLHTSHILRLSQDLPVLIEIVDTEEHVQRLLPILDEMVHEGMVTMEKVRVLRYAPRPRGAAPG